jgi:hypothetical protein
VSVGDLVTAFRAPLDLDGTMTGAKP